MELRHLRYFVAVADAPTMARAAERVFVTQSTLSHQIAQLEDELGQPLFDRVGRQLRLTAPGREFLGHARGVLAQVEEGLRSLARDRDEVRGLLRVGVIHSFVTRLMPAVCAACLEAHPALRLQVHELTGGEIEAQVAEGWLDLGLGFFPPQHEGVQGEKLFDDELLLAVHRAHPLAGRTGLRFAQLADVPLAMLGARFATRRLLDGCFQRAGVRPRVVLEIDSVDALQRVAAHGAAAAFLPARTAGREPAVQLLPVHDPRPLRAAGLLWRRGGWRGPGALAFAAQLRQVLETFEGASRHARSRPPAPRGAGRR